jgi:hypothetical protein
MIGNGLALDNFGLIDQVFDLMADWIAEGLTSVLPPGPM